MTDTQNPHGEDQVQGVVGVYLEPQSTAKNTEAKRPMTDFAFIVYCSLASFVGTFLCGMILHRLGWAGNPHKAMWQINWRTLPASLIFSVATGYLIRRHEHKKRHH